MVFQPVYCLKLIHQNETWEPKRTSGSAIIELDRLGLIDHRDGIMGMGMGKNQLIIWDTIWLFNIF